MKKQRRAQRLGIEELRRQDNNNNNNNKFSTITFNCVNFAMFNVWQVFSFALILNTIIVRTISWTHTKIHW